MEPNCSRLWYFFSTTKETKGHKGQTRSQVQQFCPIRQIRGPRYPRYVCMDCASRATSKDGRLLKFSNIDTSGGSAAEYLISGEPYDSHECYIDGRLCYADEGHFGGIVIQPIEQPF